MSKAAFPPVIIEVSPSLSKVFHFSHSPARHTCVTTDLKPTSCLALWASWLLPNLLPLQCSPLGTGGESSLECSPTEGTTRKCMWVNALPLHVWAAQTQTLHAYHYCHLREEREQQADGAQKEAILQRTLSTRAHAEMSGKTSHSVSLCNASSPWELNCISSVTSGKRTVPQRIADISICSHAWHFFLGKDEETHMLSLCPQQVDYGDSTLIH